MRPLRAKPYGRQLTDTPKLGGLAHQDATRLTSSAIHP